MREEDEKSMTDNENRNPVWQYGKATSQLDPSKENMQEERKAMIRFALDYNIRDIRTYGGYKGDLLIEITTADYTVLPILKAHAESLGMQTVVKEKYDIQVHEIYCIVPDENVYGLKQP